MPRKKGPHFDAEYKTFPGDVIEFYIYFPGSKQDVVVWAKKMTRQEIKDLLFGLAKTPRTILSPDRQKINGWRFYARKVPPEQGVWDGLNYEVEGFGPDGKELAIVFGRPETGIKAVALAVAFAKEVKLPDLAEILAKVDKELEKERKKNMKKYARSIGGAPKEVRK